MSYSELINLINDIEDRFPVDTWIIEDIHIWPLIRINMRINLINANHARKSKNNNPLTYIRKETSRVIKGFARYYYAYFKDFQKNARITSDVSAVFLSNGFSYSLINNCYYDRFCDPFIERFHKMNIASLLLTPKYEFITPRYSPSVLIQPNMDIIALLATLLRQRECQCRLEKYEEFREFVRSKVSVSILPTLLQLRLWAKKLRMFCDYYKKIIRKAEASIGFIVAYYWLEGMAFNLACRQLGVPAIEIQHGAQGDFHIAYGSWNNVPNTGYELFPTHFWCWSDHEASAIRKWSSKVPGSHEPIVGGNLWLLQWKYGTDEFISSYDKKIIDVKAEVPHLRHVLVSLQTRLSGRDTLAPLLEATKKTEDKFFWWFRLHPTMIHDRQIIIDMLKENGISRFELDVATDLPLYAVLRHIDVHVTLHSSVVLEAQSFGIPSVLIHKVGEEFYRKQIASGWAMCAYSDDEIIKAIQIQLDRKELLPKSQNMTEAKADEAFKYLLKIAKKS